MSLARALAATLALALNAAALGTGESGTLDTKATGSATGPLLGALNFVRVKHERACLSGIDAIVNNYVDPNKSAENAGVKPDPRCHPGSFNNFRYLFYSPEKPHRIIAQVYQPIGGGPTCSAPRYGEYDAIYPGDLKDVSWAGDVRATCISEFEVDTGRALAVAGEHGLPLGSLTAYDMVLIFAETGTEPDWKDKKLRGKVFWAISIADTETRARTKRARQYLVDAKTGAFLKARWRVSDD